MAPNAEKKTRHIRTPAEIASADLEVATKAVERAQTRVTNAETEVTAAKAALKAAQRRADYAAQHPDLPENVLKAEGDALADADNSLAHLDDNFIGAERDA